MLEYGMEGNCKERRMKTWIKLLWTRQDGQDMIEYALLAAAIVVTVAGFLPTTVMPSVSTIFSKITSSFATS
jgi:Flp pilus assembly pilin Flp